MWRFAESAKTVACYVMFIAAPWMGGATHAAIASYFEACGVNVNVSVDRRTDIHYPIDYNLRTIRHWTRDSQDSTTTLPHDLRTVYSGYYFIANLRMH